VKLEPDTLSEIRNLLELVEKEEAEDKIYKWGVAPAPYERLAILYRKDKNYFAEVAILERYVKQHHAPGVKPPRLLERLDKAKKLVASKAVRYQK